MGRLAGGMAGTEGVLVNQLRGGEWADWLFWNRTLGRRNFGATGRGMADLWGGLAGWWDGED